jgi:hypothetical protein
MHVLARCLGHVPVLRLDNGRKGEFGSKKTLPAIITSNVCIALAPKLSMNLGLSLYGTPCQFLLERPSVREVYSSVPTA